MISPRCRERVENGKVLYVRPERLERAMAWLRGWAVSEDASGKGESHMARQKRLHKNAYAKWSREDDSTLLAMYNAGGSVKAIAIFFGRNEGAIRSRMKKITERTLSLWK